VTRAARATRALMASAPSRKLLGLDHVLLEDQDRSRHQADFILLSSQELQRSDRRGELPHGADIWRMGGTIERLVRYTTVAAHTDTDTQQHPEQRHQRPVSARNRRAVLLQIVAAAAPPFRPNAIP